MSMCIHFHKGTYHGFFLFEGLGVKPRQLRMISVTLLLAFTPLVCSMIYREVLSVLSENDHYC